MITARCNRPIGGGSPAANVGLAQLYFMGCRVLQQAAVETPA
ncbi:MAG: hypothetical protein ACP5RH_05140 [Leptodesmis sp.]